jgi:trehalose 6-phosphate synthase/phosphatase
MSRLLVISNRLPISVTRVRNELRFNRSVGGLATGLESFYKSCKSLWIGWPGTTWETAKDAKHDIEKKLMTGNCHPVFLSKRQIEQYYYGFSNKTVWPLFGYFPSYAIYKEAFWKVYVEVNKAFCETVVKIAQPDDRIWIHDYHLMLLPKLIREILPQATIGFFLHIPFPSFEIFRLFPWRAPLLEGILGADLVGFHTYDYVRYFLDSVHRILGYEHTFGQLTPGNRVVKVDAFPMGIDYERFARAPHNPDVQKEMKRIRKKVGKRKTILSVDRLDYTKGIVQRLEAFYLFLRNNPEYRKKTTFILVAVPSRIKVEHYRLLKRQLDELVGRINGKYGTIDWIPVWYLYRSLPFHKLVALYSVADIALVTPLRDGMNLIAKEFIATKNDGRGVLILSEMAGAAQELGETLIVNPNDKDELIKALKYALTMPAEEQRERNKILQKRLQRYNVTRWAQDFMDGLSAAKKLQQERNARKLVARIRKNLIDHYAKSAYRLILLDYDGTLVPFRERPQKARPDTELLTLLQALTQHPQNEVVIISGRSKGTLDQWFGDLTVDLVGEHGAWIKEKERVWQIIEPLKKEWKEQIKPTLELYVDRTPASFIEEKEFSLIWHYRKVDPELASVRTKELENLLLHITTNLPLEVVKGNKVIEVKNAGIHKGRAVLHWISKKKWDFILAIGDDVTDEDMFAVLPESAHSVKVGLDPSQAKFNVDSVTDVRLLLKQLVR